MHGWYRTAPAFRASDRSHPRTVDSGRPSRPAIIRCPALAAFSSLLDRLINTSHQVFMNGPSYRPNKKPGHNTPTGKEDIR